MSKAKKDVCPSLGNTHGGSMNVMSLVRMKGEIVVGLNKLRKDFGVLFCTFVLFH